MAGIEELMEIFRGEPVFKKRSIFKDNVGKFVTDQADEAAVYARKFPSIIKSAKVPTEFFIKAKDTFDKKIFKQPVYPKGSNYFYGLLNETDKGKLKIDILKTLGVNAKNLTPLAITGLNTLASLPVATVTMMLQSTPANADEANMQLEDFAKLNQGTTNVDKALYDD